MIKVVFRDRVGIRNDFFYQSGGSTVWVTFDLVAMFFSSTRETPVQFVQAKCHKNKLKCHKFRTPESLRQGEWQRMTWKLEGNC